MAIRLVFAVLMGLILAGHSAGAELRAGAAAVKITPPIGTRINGGVGPVIARVVHDDLFAKCLVLDDGATRLAFVMADSCLIDRPVFDEAKRLAHQSTGIPPANMLMAATHTHSAGAVCSAHLTDADEEYRRGMPAMLAESVALAAERLAPAQLGHASGQVPQHVFCRRLKLKPGSMYINQLGEGGQLAKMNWDSPHPDELEFAGPVDPEVFILSVRHADGRPLALLANYSLHYVGDVGPGHISADYFGVFARRMEQLLGAENQDPPFVAMMSNGTSGDINANDYRVKRTPQPAYTRINGVADDVARETMRAIKDVRHRRDVVLKAQLAELSLATRRPDAVTVERARELIAGRPVEKLAGWKENYAREALILSEYPKTVSLPIQVFRVGDVAVAGWPGEIFASSGLELKKRSPIKPLFSIGLANGWYGYIPPPEQHALGAYETWLARTSFLEVAATTKMMDRFLELLGGIEEKVQH